MVWTDGLSNQRVGGAGVLYKHQKKIQQRVQSASSSQQLTKRQNTKRSSWVLYGPILPCVQTVGEEARPNIIPIHTNGARKGPAQYPVRGQMKVRGQPFKEWTKLSSEESWSMLVRNWAMSKDDGLLGTFVRGIW